MGFTCWFLLGIADIAHSGSLPLSSIPVQAAFLAKFPRFIQWQNRKTRTPSSPFRFCVMGDTRFLNSLKSVTPETIRNHPVRIEWVDSVTQATACHILYLGSQTKNLKGVLTGLDGSQVLTVSDTGGFAEGGGIIQFVQFGTKVRFEINLTRARSERLKISAKLLRLAFKIH